MLVYRRKKNNLKKKKKTVHKHICIRIKKKRRLIANKLTRISNAPKILANHDTKVLIEAGSETSRRKKCTSSRPWFLSSSIALCPFSMSLAVKITVNPRCANLFTIANPIPLFAPVTIATVSLDHHLHEKIYIYIYIYMLHKICYHGKRFGCVCV